MTWNLRQQIPAGLVQPVEYLDRIEGGEALQRFIVGRLQYQPADRAIVIALAGTFGAGSKRRLDMPDENEAGIGGVWHGSYALARANTVAVGGRFAVPRLAL